MQVTVETKQASIVFVLLPEKISEMRVQNDKFWYWLDFEPMLPAFDETLPSEGYELLGSPFSLTEEQCAKLVDAIDFGGKTFFYDYVAPGRDFRDIVDSAFETAVPSWNTLLSANDIYQTNPLGEKPDSKYYRLDGDDDFKRKWGQMVEWSKAQSRTGNWGVLVKYKSNG